MEAEKFIANAIKALNHDNYDEATIVLNGDNSLNHIELDLSETRKATSSSME